MNLPIFKNPTYTLVYKPTNKSVVLNVNEVLQFRVHLKIQCKTNPLFHKDYILKSNQEGETNEIRFDKYGEQNDDFKSQSIITDAFYQLI